MTPKAVTLTRRDIARGELDTAILLWFLEKDVVSIHVLASAALEVLQGLKKNSSIIFSGAGAAKSKTQRKKQRDHVVLPQNFFKHSKKDPNYVLDFVPETSEFLMFDAIQCYSNRFHSLTPFMRLFVARFLLTWHTATPAELPEVKEITEKLFPKTEFSSLSRKDFFEKGLRIVREAPRSDQAASL